MRPILCRSQCHHSQRIIPVSYTHLYQPSPAGTPVIIRRVVKMNNPGENSDNMYYAVEVNGIQETIPSDEMGIIAISAPETDREFWQ